MMRRGLLGLLLSSSVALSAAHAACKSESGDAPEELEEAGVEEAGTTKDGGGVTDGGAPDVAAPIDCSKDLQADGIFGHLACTGLYGDFAAKAVAADVKPYAPALELWSDGAEKSRWIHLPPGTKIDTSDFDEWYFPVGTKTWKEFKLGGKRIETRLFFKDKDGWKHTSYRWNDTETDAVRKDQGEAVPQAGKPNYQMPTVGECDVCHVGRKEPLLGFEALSLALPGAKGATLAALAADGLLSNPPPFTTAKLPENADDGTGGKAAPAIGWLHVNCGSCHNANPSASAVQTGLFTLVRPSQLAADAGVEDLDVWKTGVNQASTRTDPDAGTPFVRIAGGRPEASLVAILSGRRVAASEGPNPTVQMPPLVSRAVDENGQKKLTDWITVVPP
ncbi:MAG: hypothetical protein JST00_24750 [Deltaproteobacteria bacterium]|nr:hypothetical protein [Deltaproteobacteria bacterium]